MKVLIEIDEAFYEWTKLCGILPFIRQGKVIPDNAKNIDVLMTVFPKADIRFEGRNNELFGYIEFAGDWLEAPYKADKE